MKIDIIGRGNVGTHLARAFKEATEVNIVNPRTLEGLRRDADVYLLCVSDSAIQEVAEKLKKHIGRNTILVHSSGSTPLSVLRGLTRNTGVLYPLQTFSKDVKLEYSEIPFFIEGSDVKTENILKGMAGLVSAKVYTANSEQRRNLHIASVLSCNFVNHLWNLADGYLTERGLNFEMLIPLIRETARKIERVSPHEAQTGPAVREDGKTLESHCTVLESEPELQDLYSLLSMSIISHKHKN